MAKNGPFCSGRTEPGGRLSDGHDATAHVAARILLDLDEKGRRTLGMKHETRTGEKWRRRESKVRPPNSKARSRMRQEPTQEERTSEQGRLFIYHSHNRDLVAELEGKTAFSEAFRSGDQRDAVGKRLAKDWNIGIGAIEFRRGLSDGDSGLRETIRQIFA